MLIFNLELAEKPDHLLIRIHDGGVKRVLYQDTLLALAREREKEVVLFLIQTKMRSLGVHNSSSLSFNEILLKREQVSALLKLLAATGSLFWKGKKLFVDPFSPAQLSYHLTFQEEGSLKVEGIIEVGGKEKSASCCELLFASDPSWFIADGALKFFQEKIDNKWIKLIFPESALLQGEQKEEFLESISDEEIPDAIKVVYKNQPSKNHALSALPFLVLKDRSGGFADLWFDYAARGKVAAHEPKLPWREQELEKGWEKDLLETSFKPKLMANSHFYCPLDKVPESLSFLLDVGWKILDMQGRELVKQTDVSLFLKEEQEEVVVQGKLSFGNEEVELQKALAPFVRKEAFVALASNKVGLIDRAPIEALCGDLLAEEITGEGIRVKKSRLGLLEPLLDHPSVEKSADFLESRNSVDVGVGNGFIGTLYPYQAEGLGWLTSLRQQGFSGLLADEMGLGKTVQVIALLSTLSPPFQVLIVVPTSLLFNWKREIEKFLPGLSVYTHSGSGRMQNLQDNPVILTSYSILRQDAELLQGLSYTCVILDEAQQIKNPESQTAREAFKLKANFRLAITGTPIENSLSELWSLFYFLMPDFLGSRQAFTEELLRVPARVKKSLKPFILRRRKEEVAKDLPPKITQQVWIDMPSEQKSLYDKWVAKQQLGLLQKVMKDGAGAYRMEILEAILRLRQIACHPLLVDSGYSGSSGKLDQLMQDLEEAVQEKRKVLIYSQFTEMLHLMEARVKERGWGFVHLDGATKDRERVVNRFQNEPDLLLFFVSLKAGGVGLNLTAADTVILYDPWWNDAQEEQAIGRAHRLGRTSTVIARRYVTVGTIEEKMMALKKQKSALAYSLLEDGEELDESMEVEPNMEEFYALLSLS